MTREELLKNYILSKYKSLREFCFHIDVPYSTVTNIFQRGLMKSSVSLIINICNCLNIDLDSLVSGVIKEKTPVLNELTQREQHLVNAYRTNPSMQPAVDRLLGIADTQNMTISDDIAETIQAFAKKSTPSRSQSI